MNHFVCILDAYIHMNDQVVHGDYLWHIRLQGRLTFFFLYLLSVHKDFLMMLFGKLIWVYQMKLFGKPIME
jgi:hypothetical protein